MNPTAPRKKHLGLATDLYQLTMASAYRHHAMAERRACFHLFFRRAPFGGAYAIAAGLADVVRLVEEFGYEEEDLEYLSTLQGADGATLFGASFLDHLRTLRLDVDIDAVPEGTAVFPGEPLLRVTGSLLACQLLETPLLSIIGFQTLVATKAARVKHAAGDRPVVELGFRRAQGLDGALSASRAAYLGGADATSNALAGRLHGIPVRGTHAHSWVMAWGDERRAFDAYAEAMPGASIFVVDTYDTERGLDNAVAAGLEMRKRGDDLLGVRLDSGDLAALAALARKRLDEAGLTEAKIFASNDLDEHAILALIEAGAPIDAFGVGTRLVTGGDQPALGAVYKLGAIERGGVWSPRMKLSSDHAKSSLPGRIGVHRHREGGRPTHDVLFDLDGASSKSRADLLERVVRGGGLAALLPPLGASRERALSEVSALPAKVARLTRPERYSVRQGESLSALRERLAPAARPAKAS